MPWTAIGVGLGALVALLIVSRFVLRFEVRGGSAEDRSREPEPSGGLEDDARPHSRIVRTIHTTHDSVIEVRDRDGAVRRYSSLHDVPREKRLRILDAMKEGHGRVRERIVFWENGVKHEYASMADVPPHIRGRIEAARAQNGRSRIVIEAGGERREYARIEDVPPEYRKFLDRAEG